MTKILTKLHAIMADVSYIQKDKRNDFHKYSYASEKAIKETVHAALVKHKVIFLLSTSNFRVENGATLLDCTYRFLDAESGEEVTGAFVGSGTARDDKGNYAAVTGAIKYILTSNLLIPTGDDPEGDESAKPTKATASPAKAAPVAAPKPVRTDFSMTKEQRQRILDLAVERLGAQTPDQVIPALNARFNLSLKTSADISRTVATTLIKSLEAIKPVTAPAADDVDVDEVK